MKKRVWAVFLVLSMTSSLIFAGTFRDQRNRFREEINNKVETPLGGSGLYGSVTFTNDKAWDFQVSPAEAEKIKAELKAFYKLSDEKLISQMATDMNKGRFIVYKEFSKDADGVNLKCAFLSPKVPYWAPLTDINGIEKLFYVYNFSVAFGNKTPVDTYVMLQTQGKFMGFTKAVTLPVLFSADYNNRQLNWKMPSQAALTEWIKNLPGQGTPEQRFIALARTHQWFSEKDAAGKFVVSDDEIKKLFSDNIVNKDKKCDVYQCEGMWKINEGLSDKYYLVTYSLRTVVNIQAFIPPNIPLVGGMFKKIAQNVSDEVSVKYLPLSMKNFRDHTVKWAKESK